MPSILFESSLKAKKKNSVFLRWALLGGGKVMQLCSKQTEFLLRWLGSFSHSSTHVEGLSGLIVTSLCISIDNKTVSPNVHWRPIFACTAQSWHIFKKYLFLFKIWLCQVLVVACRIFSCSMRDLVLWPGIDPRHWELRVVATGPAGKFPDLAFRTGCRPF